MSSDHMVAAGQAGRPRRRDEYAQATRQAIVDAARRLFSSCGYFSTKVDEIAALARVSPATVYAVSGGKQGLLRTLMDAWTTDPIVAEMLERVAEMEDPAAILRVVASVCRSMHEEFGDIVRLLLATAPHDADVAASLCTATTRYRAAFVPISQRLHDLGALGDGLAVNDVVDVLWFYFGYSSLFTLRDENGWSYERAETWLCQEASRALLRCVPPAAPCP